MGNFILSSRFPQWMAHIIFNGLRNGYVFIGWKEFLPESLFHCLASELYADHLLCFCYAAI